MKYFSRYCWPVSRICALKYAETFRVLTLLVQKSFSLSLSLPPSLPHSCVHVVYTNVSKQINEFFCRTFFLETLWEDREKTIVDPSRSKRKDESKCFSNRIEPFLSFLFFLSRKRKEVLISCKRNWRESTFLVDWIVNFKSRPSHRCWDALTYDALFKAVPNLAHTRIHARPFAVRSFSYSKNSKLVTDVVLPIIALEITRKITTIFFITIKRNRLTIIKANCYSKIWTRYSSLTNTFVFGISRGDERPLPCLVISNLYQSSFQ